LPFLTEKLLLSVEFDKNYIRELNFVRLLGKLAGLVTPKHDAALMKFQKRSIE